jgi:chorismate dehydratase
MGQRIRVGAVNYLNAKPLVEGLTAFAPGIELTFDLPSRLADRMARGELDVGLIPVVELFRAGTYSVVPDVAIASRGPALSVTLFSRVSWAEIQSVELDEGSRTSAALAQVLLRKRYGISPQIEQLPIDAPADDLSADAVLLIGDRAMRACLPGFPFAYDLGQEWADWTGLPFVYAVWAVRDGVDLRGTEAAFPRAKQFGLSRAGLIAAREAPSLGLDPGYCRRYLSHIIHYDLGPRELAGLTRYHDLAAELGLAPPGVSLVHYHRPHLVESR